MAKKWTRRTAIKKGALIGSGFIPTSLAQRASYPSPVEESEPNDSLETAQMIETGRVVHGALGSTIHGEDWFGFRVRQGASITVTFQAIQMPALLDVFLVNPNGDVIDAAEKKGLYENFLAHERFELNSVANASGIYYVRVQKTAIADPGGILYGSREPYQFIANTNNDTTPTPTTPQAESTLTLTKKGTEDGLGGFFLSVNGQIKHGSNSEAVIERSSALDWVGPERGVDSIRFSGEVTQFILKGPATTYLDNSRVDPASLGSGQLHNGATSGDLPNTLTVTKDGARNELAAFAVEVDGKLGPGESCEAIFRGSTALDWVGPERGFDTIRFSGNITKFLLKGPATLYLNGSRVNPRNI